MLLPAVLSLLSPGLGEARRRKELPIDREPGEAGIQQRAKASGEQKRNIQKRIKFLNLLSVGVLVQEGKAVRQFFWVEWQGRVELGRVGLAEPIVA